jgi:stearoyl-CoA desaturase (delta-9 desaturase)
MNGRVMNERGRTKVNEQQGRARARVNYMVLVYLCLVHIIAASAFWLPKRPAHVALAVVTYFSIGFSTTIGLHRLLSHRSFQCSKWLEYLFVTFAMLTGQGSPLLWVANHRIHHGNSDREGDVHSPRRGFWYSHILWIVDDASTDPLAYQKYCKDLSEDAYYHWLVRYRLVPQAAVVLLAGATLGWSAIPLVFFLPVVCWMHSTYAVNSVCHDARFGSRLFETRDNSRNVWWVGLLALGEGWHNNHHAYPRSARHGLSTRQLDLSYMLIRLLSAARLTWNLKEPSNTSQQPAEFEYAGAKSVMKQSFEITTHLETRPPFVRRDAFAPSTTKPCEGQEQGGKCQVNAVENTPGVIKFTSKLRVRILSTYPRNRPH